MKRLFILFTGVLAILLTMGVSAQTGVGKLSGKVIDAQTKEPLVGANLIIMNTGLGAATNIDGEYFILNITPGTYAVKASYVGYAPKTITEVRVVAGITYELNIELSTDFTLDEVVVVDKKFFEEKATNTTKVYDAEQIQKLPVKGVEQIAGLNAGVVIADGSGGAAGNATINVRGGRGGEVLYIVDGVPQNDLYTGSNYSQVSNAAIEQISFQIGGYEAKYGQAQSGVINVTTKTGSPNYSFFADALTSSFTDKYGYNLYTATLGGPFIPGNGNHTFFISGERGWFGDQNPKAVGIEFKSIGKQDDVLPNNDGGLWRYTVRTTHRFNDWQVRLGANINTRDYQSYVHSYAKQNGMHNPRTTRDNYSFSGIISQNVSSNAFWNLNLGYKIFNNESGDGLWFDNLEAYGDSVANAAYGANLPFNGGRIQFDGFGMFAKYGRVNNAYSKINNASITGDFDFTAQLSNHLLEAGGGINYSTLRLFAIAPVGLASDNLKSLSKEERYKRLQPTAFGYDVTGAKVDDDGPYAVAPKNPIFAYAYIQDRFELSDMVLNLGVRLDYYDTKADILIDPTFPFGGGSDPNDFDPGDFKKKDAEIHISPRIGLGFPVTQNTVFHAQYGKFIQQPSLDQIYTSVIDLQALVTDNNLGVNNGYVESEITTQYEIGFRHVVGEIAAINLTAFYKNTEGLVNSSTVFFRRSVGGELLRYIAPTNTDFGTIKGFALSLDIARLSYFSFAVDYTYSIAEGTGSSTGSSFTAAFRNNNGEIPKVIAPLDFDQRHTGVINVDFYIPKGELGVLENLSANVLMRFNSGRPYTPLETQNLIAGTTNFGDTRGYVNSAFGPGNFRIDLKLEKPISVGGAIITPYVWIENLLDSDNPVSVYQSTGDPYTTGWLNTLEGKKVSASTPDPEGFRNDYTSLERNPFNFGIPRLIKLGVKVNFAKISF
ncbi:MAG: carboxypeptidase-like regulatory domain-containing protein [Ignavibacteriaceae bacterium]|nr:carboxypeptidase-like regulatory domain-containing protein [Ignavibacteriaceae bacterium]